MHTHARRILYKTLRLLAKTIIQIHALRHLTNTGLSSTFAENQELKLHPQEAGDQNKAHCLRAST